MYLDYKLDIEKNSIWEFAHIHASMELAPFVIYEAGKFYAKQSYYTKRSKKNSYLILYSMSGQGRLNYLNKEWPIRRGDIMIINCNYWHAYYTVSKKQNWIFYWVHFNSLFGKTYYDNLFLKGYHIPQIGINQDIISGFEKILDTIKYPFKETRWLHSDCLSVIYTRAMLEHHNFSRLETTKEKALKEALSYIHAHFDRQLNLDKLADELNISKFYLIKLFKTLIGNTPYNYLIMYRIDESKKMLRATDYSISEICRSVGYNDESNFIKAFKDLSGMTPLQYRNLHQ